VIGCARDQMGWRKVGYGREAVLAGRVTWGEREGRKRSVQEVSQRLDLGSWGGEPWSMEHVHRAGIMEHAS
jgi:hypothetical protein